MTQLFYHGTQTAIHELSAPCLDPNCAKLDPSTGRGRDKGDPEGPHVLLTRQIQAARLFSVKSEYQIANGIGAQGAHIIYRRKPDLDLKGYVYTINQEGYDRFQPLEYQGVPTHKWFSRQKLDVTKYPVMVVNGIRELMQKDSVQCFYMINDDAETRKIISDCSEIGRTRGYVAQKDYLFEKVSEGKLGCLNFDENINSSIPKTPSGSKSRKPGAYRAVSAPKRKKQVNGLTSAKASA